MKLRSKTILVTGATSGIGRRLAERLAPDNHVIASGRTGGRADALTAALPELDFIAADLARRNDVAALAEAVLERTPIDGFIHCAAVQNTPQLDDPLFDLDAAHDEVAINFTAFVHLTSVLLPTLKTRDGAFVLAVNSGLGLVPKRGSAVYCATKGALDIFCQSSRLQLADTPVRVMQAFLPLVDTPMTEGRGSNKLDADDVARRIAEGIEAGTLDNDIGKVKLLRAIRRASPALAQRIMARN